MSVSNWVLVAGAIIVGVIFLLASQNILFGWLTTTQEDIHKADSQELASLVQRVATETSKTFYLCKHYDPVNITVKDKILTFQRQNFIFTYTIPKEVNEVQLTDATNVCILKQSNEINITEDISFTFCSPDKICEDAESPPAYVDVLGHTCCPNNQPVCSSKHCCPTDKPKWCGKPKTGEPRCVDDAEYKDQGCEQICSPDISQCINHWHWNGYDGTFFMNVNGNVCDYYEVCHPDIQPIIKEIVDCCNNKCSGSCHSMCNQALSDSGLSSTDTPDTRKKCYGLYAIYGLDDAAKWMKGYQIHNEEPASIMLTSGTWMCTGYSISLTTLLRSVGYSTDEVYSQCGPGHAFNLVKFPGESQYRWVDTVGNSLYISGITSSDWYLNNHGDCRSSGLTNNPPNGCGCQNDQGTVNCPSSSDIIMGASC